MKDLSEFVHLHVHTEYSFLDSTCLLTTLLDTAARYRLPALAITDHGNMFGAIEFYTEARKRGIKPIIGCEVYIAPGSRFEKSTRGINEASFHLVLLAKDKDGYQNLMKLVTTANLEGFYYHPRIDKKVLSSYSKGLLGFSACLHGEIPHLILSGDIGKAVETAGNFEEILGKGNFYLELMDNNLPEQTKVNRALLEISRRLSIPMVATNNVHYLEKKDACAQDILLCIQTQTMINDPNRLRFQTEEFYFKSPEQMKELFKEVPEAINETIKIAEKCSLELSFDKPLLFPFKPPDGKNHDAYLREICEKGLKKRYGGKEDSSVQERLEYELSVIKKTGYASYFLIAWDAIRYAVEKEIPVGPGRWAMAGSIVAYLLGITKIDPIHYGLLFERFLNPETGNPPDIDIEFGYERRDEVIKYITEKYSKDNVAKIITFGTMSAKGAIRDVGRTIGLPCADVDRIAELVPAEPMITIDKAIEREPALRRLYHTDNEAARLLNASRVLEGLPRHVTIHSAGVVMSERPLTAHVPLFKTSDGHVTTGYSMEALEKIGLSKVDILGLRVLTVIDRTIGLLKETRKMYLDIDEIPLDDKKTYALMEREDTLGVFQLESTGVRNLLRKIRPCSFEDLIAVLVLFRPWATHMLDDYVRRKHGEVEIKYDHPLLESILKETYGMILYQEQVMRIANVLAGFPLSQADLLRRVMNKKVPEEMAKQRENFVRGAQGQGVNKEVAEKMFEYLTRFAVYGTNKSHYAAYALTAYQTAYLKANFAIEFMSVLQGMKVVE